MVRLHKQLGQRFGSISTEVNDALEIMRKVMATVHTAQNETNESKRTNLFARVARLAASARQQLVGLPSAYEQRFEQADTILSRVHSEAKALGCYAGRQGMFHMGY